MKVIIIHHKAGDTVAVVTSEATLAGVKFTEIDKEDSEGKITGNPVLQRELQVILQDVMAMFGLQVAGATKQEIDDANAKFELAATPAVESV